LRALDALDAGEEVRKRSAPHGIAAIRRRDGRWLVRTGPHETQQRFGDAVCVLRYADLCDVLLQRLPAGTLHTGSAVTAVAAGTTRQLARVSTETGDLSADLVVVADGARSAIRSELFLEHPGAVYAGFACWRAVVPWDQADPLDFGETWGKGGVGKSRLAEHAVAEAQAWDLFPDGVFLVSLEAVTDPAELPLAVTRALDAGSPRGDAWEHLRAAVARRRSLVVLDNME